MRQPRRLRLDTKDAFERELLASWRAGGPGPEGKRRALAKVAAGLGSAAAVTTASTAAATSGATGAAAGSMAPKVSALSVASLWKLAAVGTVGLATAGAVYGTTAPPAHDPVAPSAAVPHVIAENPAPPPRATPPIDSEGESAGVLPARRPIAEAPAFLLPVPVPVPVPPPPNAVLASPRPAPEPRAAVSPPPVPTAPDLSVTAQATPPAPPTSRVGDEVSSLDEARAALRRGDATAALRLLDAHDARFAGGDLAQEAALVRVQALVSQGDDARAAAAAKRFLQAYPASPYAPSVRRIAGDSH